MVSGIVAWIRWMAFQGQQSNMGCTVLNGALSPHGVCNGMSRCIMEASASWWVLMLLRSLQYSWGS